MNQEFRVGDRVEYLRESQMFPYKYGTIVELPKSDYDYQIAVDFRPLHKVEKFWVDKFDLRKLTKLDRALC